MEKVPVSELTPMERIEMLDQRRPIYGDGQVTMEHKSTKTTIPFVKNNEFNYAWLVAFIPESLRKPATWLIYVLIVIFIVTAVSNGANLTDGLDGLAAGVSFIATAVIAYIAYIHVRYEICMAFMAIAGSCIGFLPWNFHPAKIFMGDGGALYLGFMIAAISVMSPMKSATVIATILPILVLALPILDTALAILRRVKNGRPIMEADKGHLHHRIMNVGMGQKRTVLTLYCISGIMGVAAILVSRDLFIDALLLIAIAVTLIYVFMKDRGFGKPFKERNIE